MEGFMSLYVYVLVFMSASDVPAVRPAEGGGAPGGCRSETSKHEQKDRNPEYFHVYLLLPVELYGLFFYHKGCFKFEKQFCKCKRRKKLQAAAEPPSQQGPVTDEPGGNNQGRS